jgi:hypothetical protein
MIAAAIAAQSVTPGASEAQIKSPPERVLGIDPEGNPIELWEPVS